MDRFPVLKGISVLFKVLAVLILVVGLLIGLGVGNQFGAVTTFGVWILAAVYAIGLWASAELIGVLLAIEENTRQSSVSMLRATSAPGPAGSPPPGTERPGWMG